MKQIETTFLKGESPTLSLNEKHYLWRNFHFVCFILGPYRMRKRLTRNDMFYAHYPYIEQEKEQLLTKHRLAYSHDSKLLYQFCKKYAASPDIPEKLRKYYYWFLMLFETMKLHLNFLVEWENQKLFTENSLRSMSLNFFCIKCSHDIETSQLIWRASQWLVSIWGKYWAF